MYSMRTLTQVWVFLIGLTFLFLLISFELLGRVGLLFSFLISSLFFYAVLRTHLQLFKRPLEPRLFTGNDATGFLSEIEAHRLKFGFKKIYTYTTQLKSPPLVWKNSDDVGYVLIHENLLQQLNKNEIHMLAIFLLSHLENRSFVTSHILSTLRIPFYFFSIISKTISALAHRLFKTASDCFDADLKFITVAETNQFEAGYFLNRLHKLSINQSQRPNTYYFFSTLSSPDSVINEFGLPELKVRLKKIMGISL